MFARYLRRTSFGRFASCTFMSCNTSFCAIWSSVNFFAMIEADADADRALLELLAAPLFLATIVTLRGSYARNWGVAAAVGFFTLSLFTKIVKKNISFQQPPATKTIRGHHPQGRTHPTVTQFNFAWELLVGVVVVAHLVRSTVAFALCSCCVRVVLCCGADGAPVLVCEVHSSAPSPTNHAAASANTAPTTLPLNTLHRRLTRSSSRSSLLQLTVTPTHSLLARKWRRRLTRHRAYNCNWCDGAALHSPAAAGN